MTKGQFTQVVLELQSTLYHVARTQLYSSADREDAVQETLRRAWEKRDRLRDQEAVRVWLIRIRERSISIYTQQTLIHLVML